MTSMQFYSEGRCHSIALSTPGQYSMVSFLCWATRILNVAEALEQCAQSWEGPRHPFISKCLLLPGFYFSQSSKSLDF